MPETHARDRSPPRHPRGFDKDRRRSRSPERSSRRERSLGTDGQGGDEELKRSRSRSKTPEKPNFGLSGKLAAETNTVNGVVLLYNEPVEARKPRHGWRLHVFKDDDQIDVIEIHSRSAYLFGRERLVCDVPVDHPSCSKQHSVIQFREVQKKNDVGNIKKLVLPYIIDLGSTNGTIVNGDKIPAQRYYELRERDLIKFGTSTRDYILLRNDTT
ncbi:FHA domain-containing protein DDL [Neolecta irregularis DAH-3]|uniref:FHA domain-containing protein DDL n=1 Tax=Neolecta irregularis (strain DAH-3) TaxID=1198029 RepID=A0A1U7LQP7_NEOID|nr:FHA domain-containing protein DDL [Neolecta irregularis DAH-3]|eukprot:OLL24996.1 FHA domain-containing protein DDL [Neolecta irregularis DAH-3]